MIESYNNLKLHSLKSKKYQSRSISPILPAVKALYLAGILSVNFCDYSKADISGLTPCSQSKAFAKRKKQEVKELQKRMTKYEAESAPFIALKTTLERTEKRFDFYGASGLLCGSDGLPHLVAEPYLAITYG